MYQLEMIQSIQALYYFCGISCCQAYACRAKAAPHGPLTKRKSIDSNMFLQREGREVSVEQQSSHNCKISQVVICSQ